MKINRLFRNKKGVELSMNTVIVAAIALIVLIVLVLILTGNAGKLTFGLKDCEGKGGFKAENLKDCVDKGGVIIDHKYYFADADGKFNKPTSADKAVCCSV